MFKTMWPLNKSPSNQPSSNGDGPRTKECLSNDLHNEVRSAAPGARLSFILRTNLERLDKEERQGVVSVVNKSDGCAPLFVACKKGNLEIVEYLIETCNADVEQKGTYEVIDDKTSHYVTPLWCSSVCGRLNIVQCLIKHGANVNSVSDTGSTPVRSACFMTHMDIVKYLVEQAGADIQLPNFNGGTCLINSVQSAPLCEYLLNRGANVNSQDIQLKTALHYAIQEHRVETTKLLLENGADPFLKNRYGDDSLQTSCLKGAAKIFNHLLENVPGYSLERQAEMHELMGSTFLDEHHDIQVALDFWKRSIEIRFDNKTGHERLPKPTLNYVPIYSNIVDNEGKPIQVREFRTLEDLEVIATDTEMLRINSLLIAERVLGISHKDLIFRIMYRGAAYADCSKYLLCIRLWRYALQLRIEKDSILYGDTCFTALALIRLYLDLDRSLADPGYDNREVEENSLTIDDLMATFHLLIEQLPEAAKLVKVRPVFKRQQESFDRCLRCCTHLLYLLLKAEKTPQQFYQVKKATEQLVQYNVRMCLNGDSLLHMAVSRNNVVRSHFFVDDHQVIVFPNYDVAKFLIECGADVNAMNDLNATPLHHVTCGDTANFFEQVVQLLLDEGAHVDQLDLSNQSPMNILLPKTNFSFNPLNYTGLKCLAARAVGVNQIKYNSEDLPRELENFVERHRPKSRQDEGSYCSKHKVVKYSKPL